MGQAEDDDGSFAMAWTAPGGPTSGNARVMSSGTRPAMTGWSDAGTDSVTRPHPHAAPPPRQGAAGVVERPGHGERVPEGALVAAVVGRQEGRDQCGVQHERAVVVRALPAPRPVSPARGAPRASARPEASEVSAAALHAGEDGRSRSSRRASMSTGNTNAPPWVRMPNAMATAYSRSWLIETAMRSMPSCSARGAPRSWSGPWGWPVGSADDLDLAPADAADTQPQDLAHGLLGGPASGEGSRGGLRT